MSVTKTLADFAADLSPNHIPDGVKSRALALTTDFVGSIVRAAHDADSTPSVLAMIDRLGIGNDGPCTVFGLDRTYTPAAAALLNGTFGHSLDFDDTHADSSLHPSAPVIPSTFSAAELSQASGADFVTAVVIGFEVCCRLGMALNPTVHYARGFHPTATAGTFGAAAAVGRILGLNGETMSSAFGIAASQASGSLQFLVNGAWNKRYQVGEASMKGLMAATLADCSFVGANDAIDGKHGFLGGYSDAADPARAVAGLGSTWETLRIGVKPYPSCRYTHAAIDGLLSLKRGLDLAAEDVERITVGLHRNGITLVGAPLSEKRRTLSIVQGQFSMPFVAAAAILRGSFGWDDYNLLGKPEAQALAARVDVVRDESLENLCHPFGATLTVRARNIEHRLRIPDPSGEPETFLDDETIALKFRTLARPVLNDGTDNFLSRLHQLPQAPSLRGWFG